MAIVQKQSIDKPEPDYDGTEKLRELEEEYKRPYGSLGVINVRRLYSKNPDIIFDEWKDMYKERHIQDQMRDALVNTAGCSLAQVDRFINKLNDGDEGAKEALDQLTDNLIDYGRVYKEATQEADDFKLGIIGDSITDFLKTDIVEGFQTKPIGTLVKAGITAILIHQVYKRIGENAKKWVWGGALAVGGVYLLNDFWPRVDKQGRSLFDIMSGGNNTVDSPAMQRFLDEAGVENREGIGALQVVNEVSVDNLVAEYRDGRRRGDGQIRISRLKRFVGDKDKRRRLDNLDTKSNRRTLYNAIEQLIALAGFSTPDEFLVEYGGEPLISVIMTVFDKAGINRVSEGDEKAKQAAIEQRNLTSEDKHLHFLLVDPSGQYKEDIPKGIDILVGKNTLFINGYPFEYELAETDTVVQRVILLDPATHNPLGDFDEIILGDEYNSSTFIDTLKTIAGQIETEVNEDFDGVKNEYKIGGVSVLAGFKAQFNKRKHYWEIVKASDSSRFKMADIPKLGIEGRDLDIRMRYFSGGRFEIFEEDSPEDEFDPTTFEDDLVRIALNKNLQSEVGPKLWRSGTNMHIDSYDKATGEIMASSPGGTIMKLWYDETGSKKYEIIDITWAEGDEAVLVEYKKDMHDLTQTIVENRLGPMLLEDIAGYRKLKGHVREFEELTEVKADHLSLLYIEKMMTLKASKGDDFEKQVEALRTLVRDNLDRDLAKIEGHYARDVVSGATSGRAAAEVSATDFKSNYLDALLTAGMINSDYKKEVLAISDDLFHGQYNYNITIDRQFDNYYEVKNEALRRFFDKTGQFSMDNDPMADKEKAYTRNTARAAITFSLQEAYLNSNSVQKAAGWITNHSKRIGFKEINWRDIEDYDETIDYGDPGYRGAGIEIPTGPGGINQEMPDFEVEDSDWYDKGKPEVIWDKYEFFVKDVITAQFDALKQKSGAIQFDSTSGYVGDAVASHNTHQILTALLTRKEAEFQSHALTEVRVWEGFLTAAYTTHKTGIGTFDSKIFEDFFNDNVSAVLDDDIYKLHNIHEKLTHNNGELSEEYILDILSDIVNFPAEMPGEVTAIGDEIKARIQEIEAVQLERYKQEQKRQKNINESKSTANEDSKIKKLKAKRRALVNGGDYVDFAGSTINVPKGLNELAKDPACPQLQSDYREYLELLFMDGYIDKAVPPNADDFARKAFAYEYVDPSTPTGTAGLPEWTSEYLSIQYETLFAKAEFKGRTDFLVHYNQYEVNVKNPMIKEFEKIRDKWGPGSTGSHALEYKMMVMKDLMETQIAFLDARNTFWEQAIAAKSTISGPGVDDIAAYELTIYNQFGGTSHIKGPSHERVELYKMITAAAVKAIADQDNLTTAEITLMLSSSIPSSNVIQAGTLHPHIYKTDPDWFN